MKLRALLIGFVIWLAATIAIRLFGEHIFKIPALLLYAVSFVLMALLVRWLCAWLGAEGDARRSAATLLMLPTLSLDAFSCLYFSTVFPNLRPALAGVFGGWMLICCAGAVAGVWVRR